jgi:hypothetical protein
MSAKCDYDECIAMVSPAPAVYLILEKEGTQLRIGGKDEMTPSQFDEEIKPVTCRDCGTEVEEGSQQ